MALGAALLSALLSAGILEAGATAGSSVVFDWKENPEDCYLECGSFRYEIKENYTNITKYSSGGWCVKLSQHVTCEDSKVTCTSTQGHIKKVKHKWTDCNVEPTTGPTFAAPITTRTDTTVAATTGTNTMTVAATTGTDMTVAAVTESSKAAVIVIGVIIGIVIGVIIGIVIIGIVIAICWKRREIRDCWRNILQRGDTVASNDPELGGAETLCLNGSGVSSSGVSSNGVSSNGVSSNGVSSITHNTVLHF